MGKNFSTGLNVDVQDVKTPARFHQSKQVWVNDQIVMSEAGNRLEVSRDGAFLTTVALPLKVNKSVIVAAGTSATITLAIPIGQRWIANDINNDAGGLTGVAVDEIRTDGVATGETASFNTETVFGEKLVLEESIEIDVTNTDTADHTVTLTAIGVYQQI
jgi:hypothetical protein